MPPTSTWALFCSFQEFSLTKPLEVMPSLNQVAGAELGAQRQEALGAVRPPSPGERAVARGRKDSHAQVSSTTFLLPLPPPHPPPEAWIQVLIRWRPSL